MRSFIAALLTERKSIKGQERLAGVMPVNYIGSTLVSHSGITLVARVT